MTIDNYFTSNEQMAGNESLESRTHKFLNEFSGNLEQERVIQEVGKISDKYDAHKSKFKGELSDIKSKYKVPKKGETIKDNKVVDTILGTYLMSLADHMKGNSKHLKTFKQLISDGTLETAEEIQAHVFKLAEDTMNLSREQIGQLRAKIKENKDPPSKMYKGIEDYFKSEEQNGYHTQDWIKKFDYHILSNPEHRESDDNHLESWVKKQSHFKKNYDIAHDNKFKHLGMTGENGLRFVVGLSNKQMLGERELKSYGLSFSGEDAKKVYKFKDHDTKIHEFPAKREYKKTA
jgi:hypothetical protein